MGRTASPPSPDGLPIVGHGLAFTRDPTGAMESWAAHGDIVHLRFLGESWYLVTGPELVETILVDDHDRFTIADEQQATFEGIEDHAMTTATGDRWKRLRRAVHPAFTRERVESYGDRVAAVTARFVDAWPEGCTVDLQRAMQRLTVQILCETLLDEDVRGREDVVVDAADAFVDRSDFRRPGQLLPDWLPTPTERRFLEAVAELDAFVDDLVDARRGSTAGAGENDDPDVCTVLLAAHEAGELSLPEVRHNLVALLLAGHESPSGALTRVWYLLEKHPEVREALRAEYDRVVSGDRPTAETYDDLEYTRRVVDETLRLLPPTTGVSRQATEPVTLAGYDLPAGARFLLPQWVPHRDERFWEDPTSFDPDRWTRDVERPAYAYFPFSGGPRRCVGDDFARQELTLALATMIGRVDLEVTAAEPLSFVPSLQLRLESDVAGVVRHRPATDG